MRGRNETNEDRVVEELIKLGMPGHCGDCKDYKPCSKLGAVLYCPWLAKEQELVGRKKQEKQRKSSCASEFHVQRLVKGRNWS